MMKVCLVRCPSPFLIDDRCLPPLGLMSVGTYLKTKGHEVLLYDKDLENVPLDYEYYGFGPTTPEYGFALDTKDRIREYNPSPRIIIGGPYATLDTNRCLEDGFDCVVTGDGEPAIEQALFDKSLRIVNGGEEHSLDEYPITDRSLLDIYNYRYFLNGRLATTVMTARGCPYKCSFCAKNYKKVRFRSVGKVIEEIELLHRDFGYNAFAFPEDLFILNRNRVEKICECLKRNDILWRCLVRADLVVKYGQEFVNIMASSGCVDVGMGIESGSDRILKIINKGESSGTMREAINMLKKTGIRVKGFFITGLPGENEESLKETREFLTASHLDDIDMKIYQPYPGTPIWNNKNDFDIEWDDNIDYGKKFYKGRIGEYYGNVCTSSLTNARIRENTFEMERMFKRACA